MTEYEEARRKGVYTYLIIFLWDLKIIDTRIGMKALRYTANAP